MVDNVIERIRNLNFEELFIYDDISEVNYTYNKFFAQALKVARYIESSVPSDSVIAVMENSYELALLYFSVMLTDKRILVVDPQKGKQEILSVINDIEDTILFIDGGLDLDSFTKHNILDFPKDRIDYIKIKDIKKEVTQKLKMRSSEKAYLVTFTSGTSGVTKGVEHTLDNLFLTAIALDNKVKKNHGTFLHVMPMTYMAGILNSLIYPFLAGVKIVIAKRFSIISARCFWKIVTKYNADLFWLSPSMLMMINQMDRKKDGENYCKNKEVVFLIGTAPLTNELRKTFNNRYGVSVFASYGLSETLFISVETRESLRRSEANSVGELLPGVEYIINDDGEMYIKVPWMYLRYTNENTAEYFDGEYYKSGDLAQLKDGCLYITGRSKDLIIKGGMNISPALIENVISKNKDILECVVIGVKDSTGEEKVCCTYRLKNAVDDRTLLEAGLKKLVIGELGKNYTIDYLWQLDEIPRNINGKIDKNILIKNWRIRNGK